MVDSDQYVIKNTNVCENAPRSLAAITWDREGSYKYGMPIEEMLKSDIEIVRNFAICIRDAYEAGLRGDKIPMHGKP